MHRGTAAGCLALLLLGVSAGCSHGNARNASSSGRHYASASQLADSLSGVAHCAAATSTQVTCTTLDGQHAFGGWWYKDRTAMLAASKNDKPDVEPHLVSGDNWVLLIADKSLIPDVEAATGGHVGVTH